jgi:tRNA dimethylallyltransferase
LGYKEVIEYLNNEITYEEMIEKIKMESRRYAKRQITWFKKTKGIIWLNGENKEEMISIITKDYLKR